ncbi:MAG: S-layer homology domain-containing protein [Armatimonadetes bacterium]|nr:S-layer homology domain-containing protein [Armatimonadota bacterium]
MLRRTYLVPLMLVALLMVSSVAFAAPWIMMEYLMPLTPTSAPVPTALTVPTFDDVAAPSDAHWAWGQIEECAATHTASSDFIVQGYGDGSYQPSWQVTRGQMAVFIARAAGWPTEAFDATFEDVDDGFWAFMEIELCVEHGVVQGYEFPDPAPEAEEGDTIAMYLPGVVVDRAQMAVYIGRAVATTTSVLYADAFDDVDGSHWAADWIQECVNRNIVQGYGGGVYLPDVKVTRAQMAVFVWRGMVRDDGDVVLGGPEASDDPWLDPAEGELKLFLASDFAGTTNPNTVDVGPGTNVYIALDAVQFGGPNVVFEFSDSEGVLDTETSATLDADDGGDIVTAADGVPYLVYGYGIASGLADEDYTLTITLPNGNIQTLAFSVPPAEEE